MENSITPQSTESHHDEYDSEGDRLFNAYITDKNNYALLKEAAILYGKSRNPEGKQKSLLLLGIYYREMGFHEKDDRRAAGLLRKACIFIGKVCGKDGEETKRVILEYLKKKIATYKNNQKPPKELFLKRAKMFQELNDVKNYNIEMSLYYMYSMMESKYPDEKGINNANLMVQHAKESGNKNFYYKAKILFHQLKSAIELSPINSLKEIEEALYLIQQTEDRYGEEEARARLCFTKGLLTINKSKRKALLQEAAKIWDKQGNKQQLVTVMEMLLPVPIKVSIILNLADQALKNHQLLNKKVHELITITPGTYALFHHHAHLIERIKDVKNIIKRLGENRKEITDLSIKEDALRPSKVRSGKPLPKRLQTIMRKHHELVEQMKLDMESLYVFGNLLLDQWSYVIAYLTGMNEPCGVNFRVLYDKISSKKDIGQLSLLKDRHRKDIYWLYYQMRSYRNIFIEHVRRPWQRGNTMTVYGNDFNLFIPTPPGWLDDKETQKHLQGIFHLAPKALQDAPDDYWEKKNLNRVLEVTFMNIDEIEEKENREKVWDVWKVIGGSTPSYDSVGYRLMDFITNSIPTLIDTVLKNPERIDIGKKENIS